MEFTKEEIDLIRISLIVTKDLWESSRGINLDKTIDNKISLSNQILLKLK